MFLAPRLDSFSVVLQLTRVSVDTGGMRQYLDPTEVAQTVKPLWGPVQLHQGHQYMPFPKGLLCLPG